MPLKSKPLGAALVIIAVLAMIIATPVRAQQDAPPAGQQPVTEAKPQDVPPAAADEPKIPAPTALAPTAPQSPPQRAPGRGGPAKSAGVIANVNLRSGPGTDSDVVATIPAGSVVRVADCDGEWCAVTWNGRSGYAISRNLAIGTQRQAQLNRAPAGYAGGYPVAPPVVYEAPAYYGPPVVAYGPAYYGPRVYYRPGWGWRRYW
jgi:uncharacterized protein YraI